MTPVEFKESNITISKDQPPYLPLPAKYDRLDPRGLVISCWRMTWRERMRVFFTGRVYVGNLTFRQALQPQVLGVSVRAIEGVQS